MMNLEYPVNLEPAEEGGFVVSFPGVPEAITQGEDEEEALARAADALETPLEFYTEEGRDLPKPGRPRRGQRTVRPSALVCVKLAVYQTMRDEGVRKAELARRLGWHLPAGRSPPRSAPRIAARPSRSSAKCAQGGASWLICSHRDNDSPRAIPDQRQALVVVGSPR